MPKYRIDGKVYEATDPEDAYRQAGQAHGSPEAAKLQAEVGGSNPLTKAAVGFSTPFVEAAQGVKQLVQGKDYDPSTINQWRGAREGAGGWGTAGEAATWALPGGAGVKGVSKALPMAGKLIPAMVAGAAEQGGYEALRPSVGEDPSRGERAATGALWGAGGASAGQLLPRALGAVGRGISEASGDAANLIGQFKRAGMKSPLSVGQTLGGAWKKWEDRLAGYPGTGIVGGREKALKAWNTAEMTNAAKSAAERIEEGLGDLQTPKQYPAGHKGQARITDDVRQLYDRVFRGLPDIELPEKGGFENAFAGISNLAGEQKSQAETVLMGVMRKLQDGVPGSRVKEIESELRETARNAYRNGQYDLGEALDAIKADFRSLYTANMSERTKRILGSADKLYAETRPMQEAAATQGALTRGGVFTPAQQLSRIRANARPSQLAAGRVPGQVQAETANRVLGSSLPEVGPGTAEKVLGSGVTGTAIGSALGLVSPAAAAVSMLPMAAGQALSSPGVARAATGQAAFQTPQVKALAEQIAQKFGVSAEVAAAWLAQQMNGASNAP